VNSSGVDHKAGKKLRINDKQYFFHIVKIHTIVNHDHNCVSCEVHVRDVDSKFVTTDFLKQPSAPHTLVLSIIKCSFKPLSSIRVRAVVIQVCEVFA
jgi:hypothetical protein